MKLDDFSIETRSYTTHTSWVIIRTLVFFYFDYWEDTLRPKVLRFYLICLLTSLVDHPKYYSILEFYVNVYV